LTHAVIPKNNPRAKLHLFPGLALRASFKNIPSHSIPFLAFYVGITLLALLATPPVAQAQDAIWQGYGWRSVDLSSWPAQFEPFESPPASQFPSLHFLTSQEPPATQPAPVPNGAPAPLTDQLTNQPTDEESLALEEDPIYTAPPGAMAFGGFRHWLHNTPFFGNPIDDVRDPRRHWGVGVPLEGTSWRNRPWHVGFLLGFVDGGEVANGTVLQDSGLLWGIRFGNDFDHYWGWELRAATAQVDLNRNDTGAPLAQDGRNTYYDVNLLYYPLGDTRWRPYFSLGLGASTQGFADLQGNSYDETTACIPFAMGIKYFVRPGTSIRADFTNNFSLGTSNAPGSDNISLSIGLDLHFGGRRKVYYPWDPSIQVW
jgi:hypothetical protein